MVLDEHIARRRAIHELYVEKLRNTPGITVMQPRSTVDLHPNYWLSTILVNPQEAGFTWQELSARLTAADIESRPLWKPMHLQPVFANTPRYVNGVSEALFTQGLCLPSGPLVTDEDVDRIVNIIKS